MTTPPQTFKNRTVALAWLRAQGLSLSHGKFYPDCDKRKMVQPDKSVHLADLIGYVKEELKVNLITGQSLGERDRAGEKEAEELRHIKLKNDKLERENRAEDERWLLKEDAHAQMAAIFGLLRDSLRHHAHRAGAALVHLAGGEAGRAPEVSEGIEEEIFARAFNEVAGAGRVEVVFEGGEE